MSYNKFVIGLILVRNSSLEKSRIGNREKKILHEAHFHIKGLFYFFFWEISLLNFILELEQK